MFGMVRKTAMITVLFAQAPDKYRPFTPAPLPLGHLACYLMTLLREAGG
jgi:hypothetical protein